MTSIHSELATIAGGCFWCIEAIMQRLRGVVSATSGYTGGWQENPTYEDVCSGKTGHTEAVQISFDPNSISYKDLLDVFFHLHDPTTPNRQGPDTGTQYRSAVYYHSESQKQEAENVIAAINESKLYPLAVITQLLPAEKFYSAEAYHQEYFNKNSYVPYCQAIIDPKIKKLFKEYREKIKPEYKEA